MNCIFICLLLVSSLSSFISMTYYILCTITYIISYPIPISSLLSCSGYTPILCYSFLTYCFIIYFLIRTCIVIYFHFILYCHIVLPYIFILYFSYTIISYDFYILCFSYTLSFILSVIYIFVSLTLYFLYLYTCHILFYFIYCTCSYTVLSYTVFSYTVILYFTSCSCNCILSSHSSAMLLISCYILFAFHLHILVIYFSLSYNVLFIYFSCTTLFIYCHLVLYFLFL